MAWFIYSTEALPNPKFMGKARYTPDGCWIKWGGVALPAIPEKQWMALPDTMHTIRRADWRDKQGQEVEISIRKYKPVVDGKFAELGVIMIDHEPSAAEKKELEALSQELNTKYRAKAIEFFENERAKAIARQGTYEPSLYVDECYDLMKFPKPYSVDTLKSQRMPGHEAAERIADAITGALKRDREDAAMELAAKLVAKPEPQQQQARR